MPEPIQLLDVVALTIDLPDEGLRRGNVGTVEELLAPDVDEVEFSDDQSGQTYAILPHAAALIADPVGLHNLSNSGTIQGGGRRRCQTTPIDHAWST